VPFLTSFRPFILQVFIFVVEWTYRFPFIKMIMQPIDAENICNNVVKPLITELLDAMDVIHETPQYTAAERAELSGQLAICHVTLSTFEHILNTQRTLRPQQDLDLRQAVTAISTLVANIHHFDLKIKEHWGHLNPGRQTQEAVNA